MTYVWPIGPFVTVFWYVELNDVAVPYKYPLEDRRLVIDMVNLTDIKYPCRALTIHNSHLTPHPLSTSSPSPYPQP